MGKHGHSGMFKVNLPWPLSGFSWQAPLRNRADGDARDALFCSGSEAARGIHGCLAFASGGLGILSTRLCAGGPWYPVRSGRASGRTALPVDGLFLYDPDSVRSNIALFTRFSVRGTSSEGERRSFSP
ncbi:MAG: hypothetical protein DBY37_02770 [Desulfovibrionaceae bacterium]|nr:MAG: hypothetical protein DBY37_02770 [Desulfovibrionaceae bacterium]